MLKLLLRVSAIVVVVFSFFLTSPTISYQNQAAKAFEGKVYSSFELNDPNTIVVTLKAEKDNRAKRLKGFLVSQGSPLAPYADNFVRISDKYDLDWRFLPAIAGVESTFGQAVPYGSYNPYGWNNGKHYFKNWVVATDFVASQIDNRWGYMGRVTPWKIGSYYASSPTWASKVSNYMTIIGNY